jgi:hypothetical protein
VSDDHRLKRHEHPRACRSSKFDKYRASAGFRDERLSSAADSGSMRLLGVAVDFPFEVEKEKYRHTDHESNPGNTHQSVVGREKIH